jgi:beta-lactamase regulating signal transducer with metallopeptidase domain
MAVALILLLGALLVAWLGPRLLERQLHAGTHPQTTLVTWLSLVAGTLLSLGIAIALVLLPGHGPAWRVVRLVHHCWAAVSAGEIPGVDELVGLLSVSIAAIGVARCGVGTLRYLRRRKRVHRTHLDLLRILTGSPELRNPTLWLNSSHATAYSLAGRPSLVVATEGLRRQLPEQSVDAVLAHERAHLSGRHHLLVALAESIAAGLPWLPLARRSPALVRTLVEVSADSVAARAHGAAAVRHALRRMSAAGVPNHALGMAREDLTLRIEALSAEPRGRSELRRIVGSGVAAALAFALPALASAALLGVASVTACAVLA